MPNIKLNKEVIFMWRPETRGEKAARENPQVAKPQPQFGQKPKVEVLSDEGSGCIDDFIKIVQYVVCCCGCCTSYDEFHGHSDPSQIDWNSIHAENS